MQVTFDAPTERGGFRASRWLSRLTVMGLSIAAFLGPVGSALATSMRTSGAVLGGMTSQQWPVVLKVSPNGRTLRLATAALSLKCTSGGQIVLPGSIGHVPISTNGSFRAGGVIPPTKESDGSTFGASEVVRGALNHGRTRASGSWQLHVTITPPGGQADQCDSGIVRFRATH